MTLDILANAGVRMLLMSACVWLVLRALRVRNSHVEALAWRLVLLAGFALPVLMYFRLAPSFTTTLELPAIVAGTGAAPAAVTADAAASLPAGVLASIYLVVTLLLLGRLLAGLAGMWRVSRAARPMATPDDVRISAQVRSPATFGSIILLPADADTWSADRLAAVLAHERAHVRSRDGLWSWLAQVHAAVFWINPLAWWLRQRLEVLAETTSDDAVVAARHDPLAYAALLLDFARHPNSRSVAMSVAESNVSERIERLLARTPPATALPRAARWSAFAALIPVVVFAASSTRAAPSEEPASALVPTSNTTPSVARPPTAARIQRTPYPDEYYPAVAKALGVSGSVVVRVDVDALGQFVDARVVDVQPADPQYGFADAALRVARASHYGSPSQQPASVTFRVKFDVKKEGPKDGRK